MYLAVDGNSVGKQLEKLILSNDSEGLQLFSQSVCGTISDVKQRILTGNGTIYMSGGDNIFAICSRKCAKSVTDFIRNENGKKDVTYSVAVGETMQDTYLALNYAKDSNDKNPYIEAYRDKNSLTFLPFD